jgi:hypothetical protein
VLFDLVAFTIPLAGGFGKLGMRDPRH